MVSNIANLKSKLYPLRPMQRWIIDTHFERVKSTMMNIGALFKLDPSIDLKRIENAANDIVKYHDVFRCRFALDLESGDICQYFDEKTPPVIYMRMDDEQLKLNMKYLRMPFDLMEAPLYRMYIIETDADNYFFFDYYHAMFDGWTTIILFFRELNMRYCGREFKIPSVSYEQFLIDRQKISPSEFDKDYGGGVERQYWRRMFDGFDPEKHLPPADLEGDEGWSQGIIKIPLKNIDQSFFKDKTLSMNTFFIAVSMLTVAKSAGQSDAKISWVHNGRSHLREKKMFALMLEQYPIAWDFKRDQTVSEFLSGVDDKINEGFQYREGLAAAYEEGLEDYCVCFLLQKSILKNVDFTVKVGDTEMIEVELPPDDMSAVENALDIELHLKKDNSFTLLLDYDASRYSERAMKNFAALFDEISLAMQDGDRMVSTING